MNKKILISIIVIAAAALGIVIFGNDTDRERSPAQRPAQEEQKQEEASAEVIYTDTGYNPKILRVKSGDTVTFKNQSSRLMWTASDVHPVHTIYPEFDSKSGTTSGQSYSFTFTRIGQWNYHNHLRPGDNGTIVVE